MTHNEWLIGTLITFIVAAVCLLAVIVSAKWYFPRTGVFKVGSLLAAGMAIVGLASFNMLTQSGQSDMPRQSDNVHLYKQLYWLQNDTPEFALSKAKQMWEHTPSADSKLILGLAYINARQPEMGAPILTELADDSRKAAYMSVSELDLLLQDITAATAEDVDSAGRAEYERIAAGAADMLRERIRSDVNDQQEREILTLAQLDPDRIDYIYKAAHDGEYDAGAAQAEIDSLYREAVSGPPDDPSFKVELAKTAVYMGDSGHAGQLLTDVLRQYPDAEEPSMLLGELLLSGAGVIEEERLQLLPAYQEAKLRHRQEQKRLLQDWSNEVRPGDEQAARIVQNRLNEIQSILDLEPHLAYALLKPLEARSDNPQVEFLMAEYYFQMHEIDKSADYIHQIAEHPSNLTVPQQYYVQSLRSLPDAGQMSLAELQERNELTNEVYRSFKTMNGKRLTEAEPTDQERSFAVHLSNQLIHLNKSRIRISSIQAAENGQVELYVTTDNVDELTKSTLKIRDNATDIKDFSIEKISEASHYKRNIVMIIDRSGSMDGERIDAARLAVQNFVHDLRENERIGVIAFSDGSFVLNPITSNLPPVMEAVGEISAGGGTNIAEALNSGMELIGRESGERVLFILSDGEDDNFSLPETRAGIIQRANEEGVTVFAVGFGAGYETLRDVAEATGGKYLAAAGLDDLMISFAEIKATLERSYKISYTLDPMEEGVHRVGLTGPNDTKASKTYTIGMDADAAGSGPLVGDGATVEADWIDFAINQTIPNRITASALGTTNVQILGIGFGSVEKVAFNNEDIRFNRVSDTRLDITVRNNLALGIHKIKLIAKDQRELEYNLSVAKSGDQEYRAFGDARVYADFIKDEPGTAHFMGNTSVDRFLYDARGEMKLEGGRVLTFSGLLANVDKTKIGIAPAAAVGASNLKERFLPDNITMEVQNNQKTFQITRSNAARDILDKATLGKFGLEVYLAPNLTYEAKYKGDGGTLKSKAGIKGFSFLGDLKSPHIDRWMQTVKFLPSDANLEIGYETDNITVSGEVGAALQLGSLLETGGTKLSAAYEHKTGKFDLGMEIEDFKGTIRAFSFDVTSDAGALINKFGLKLGWQGSILPRAGEVLVGSPRGVPLGTTGLTARAVKVGIDGREGFGGVLGTEVGTAVDGPFQKAIEWVNKLPLVDMDPNSACVLCVEGEAGVKSLGTEEWSVNGAMTLKVIGFELSKRTAYIDANEISAGTFIEPINFDGNTRLLWHDYNYGGDLTITYRGSLNVMELTGDMALFLNASRFDQSYLIMEAEAWMFEPHIHLGADPAVYR
ncbi:vWA domain-containing protein [Paenibacillus abyssi]|uniref:VWFA domain-containing protein n=1 Tax=Paenibacillus abyssi TaxID=1340531 RepID=A0A917D1U0_9BACL|nr:vWA domain-containing protein [Paenibacillus abyssi]GGG09011.1 hypothetical protein GCM10010916_27260 [Paenibacillus abyssi]